MLKHPSVSISIRQYPSASVSITFDIYVCAAMHMSRKSNLWISPELRRAINSLNVSFAEDYWEDRFESVTPVLRSKYRALASSIQKVTGTYGQKDDFWTLREACVPTGWLVTFLESWKLSVDHSAGRTQNLVDFIQGVIDKVGNVYTMLNAAGEGHHNWIEVACMSSLLSQLQRMADK